MRQISTAQYKDMEVQSIWTCHELAV